MDKLLNLFGIGWVKWLAIISVFVAYTVLIYNQGIKSEKINTQKLENKYLKDSVELERLRFDTLADNVKALNDASSNFQKYQGKANTIIKQINTETTKEIEKPIYKECVVSDDFFESINVKIKELNQGK